MTQLDFPRSTDEMVRSPEYLNRLIAAFKRSYDKKRTNHFYGGVKTVALADDKSTILLLLNRTGSYGVGTWLFDQANIPEIEPGTPGDEGMSLEGIYAVAQEVLVGDVDLQIHRRPSAGGDDLLKTLVLALADSPRAKVSDTTVSQVFKKDDLLVGQLVVGAGETVTDVNVICEFIVGHASS